MGHFGSKKDSKGWFKSQKEVDLPDSLGKKLLREQRKRSAAEKELARWKRKYKELEEKLKMFTGAR